MRYFVRGAKLILVCLALGGIGWLRMHSANNASRADVDELVAQLRAKGAGISLDKSTADPKVRIVSLSGRRAEGVSLEDLSGQFDLRELDLIEIPTIGSYQLRHVAQLPSLEVLRLSGCRLVNDAALRHVRSLHRLKTLDLERCHQITDVGLAETADLASLETLDLSECVLISDRGVSHLEHLSRLRRLDLDHCPLLTDDALTSLACLERLEVLDLGGCNRLTDRGVQSLASLQLLELLDLTGCVGVSDAAVDTFVRLPRLKSLLIAGSAIGDDGVRRLADVSTLERIDVRSTKVTATGVAQLIQLKPPPLSIVHSLKDVGGAAPH